jgi:Tol biopolymer transport system component
MREWAVKLDAKPKYSSPATCARACRSSRTRPRPASRWLAYASTDCVIPDVYVRSFPTGSTVSRVTSNGAAVPRWRADGRELYFAKLEDIGKRFLINRAIDTGCQR